MSGPDFLKPYFIKIGRKWFIIDHSAVRDAQQTDQRVLGRRYTGGECQFMQ
ncbi:hypothetical protein D3C87_2125860 [compost metagenome]